MKPPRQKTPRPLRIRRSETAIFTEVMVRLSIGVENWRDLLAEFERALGTA